MVTVQSLDPRTKLVFVMLASSLAVFVQNISLLVLVFFLCLFAVFLVGENLWRLASKMRKFFMLFFAVAVIQSIFAQQGQAILHLGSLPVLTDLGFWRGAQTILRFLIIVTSAAVMATSNSREIIQGLVQWKIPYEIAFMVSIAIRFLPLIREEAIDTLTAIQLRGVDLKKIPFYKRIKIYSYLLMPMISSVIIKSQELSVAMEMRAFRAYPRRTSYRVLKMRPIDYLVMSFSFLIFLAFLFVYIQII